MADLPSDVLSWIVVGFIGRGNVRLSRVAITIYGERTDADTRFV